MITVRKSVERGFADHGWLKSHHTFSFADYYDPEHMGFRSLRVINEDYVEPGQGFGTHPHRDMEIITYVVKGAVAHKDSMGSSATVTPGEVQVMSAGTGVTHSEFNPSDMEKLHLLQIWIKPKVRGTKPSYSQKAFPDNERKDKLKLMAAADGRADAVSIGQDTSLYSSLLSAATTLKHQFKTGRAGWLQVVSGDLTVNGISLHPGDGAKIEEEASIEILAKTASEFLLFDLA